MSWYDFLVGFSYVSIGSVFIPISCFIHRKKRTTVSWLLFAILIISLVADLGNEIYIRTGHRGYWIISMFFAFQFILLCIIFTRLLEKKKFVYITIVSFLILFPLYSLFYQSINEFQSLLVMAEGIFMIALSVMFFWEIYYDLSVKNPFGYFSVWINIAVFYYYSYSLFLFVSADYVFTDTSLQQGLIFWGFHNLNNILKNCLFAIGIYLGKEK